VASLKNRDELLNLIFCLLALHFFVKWVDFKKIKFLITGLIFYILALLSKETAMGFLFIFPLVLYFFTDIKQKKLLYFSGVVVIIALIAAGGPFLYLPEYDREIWFMENPLSAEENIWNRFATAFYILLFYIKKLFYPFPMLYYYGYNMIPVVSWTNIWAILSLIFYLGIFIYAILNFKKKHILSFAILFFMITIAMYSNILMPVPGIVGDRFMLFPSLAFAIVISYFLFKIFRLSPKAQKISSGNIAKVLIVLFIILIPYSVLTFNRNKDWRTYYSLFNADIKYLENSVKANDLLATELIRQVDKELRSKPVNVLKFLRPTINRAIKHYKKALEIYPEHYSSWNNLGTIYTRLYKEHELAISCFEKCIKYKPDFPNVYFNMGLAYENLGNHEKALEYYSECYKMDTTNIFPMSRIANMYFKNGNYEEAIDINNQLIIRAPESDIPYINLGNYYFAISDTTKAMYFYGKAIEKGSQTNVSMILYNYYKEKGDWLKANYYFGKANQERKAKQGDRK
jgi:tetratricopeptide (TPR) repeat protein